MAINFIRTDTMGGGRPNAKRSIANLSDGYRVAVIYDLGQILVYVATQTGSFTLNQTITTDNSASSGYVISCSVDAANNLHIAWRTLNYNVKYAYLVYNAGTHAYGSALQTVLYSGTQWRPDSIDVDCAGDAGHNRWAVVTAHQSDSTGQKQTRMQAFVIDNSVGFFFTYTSPTLTTSQNNLDYQRQDITVQCLKQSDPVADGHFVFAVLHTLSGGSNDLGDVLKVFSFDTGTHAFTIPSTYNLPTAGKAAGRRRYFLFNRESDDTFYVVGAGLTKYQFAMKFSVDTLGALTILSPPSIKTTDRGNLQSPGNVLGFWSYMTPFNNKAGLGSNTRYNCYQTDVLGFRDDDSISWDEGGTAWDLQGVGATYRLANCSSGSARYQSTLPSIVRYFTDSSSSSFRVDVVRLVTADAPITTKPANGSTLDTSYPVLEARYQLPDDTPKCRYRMGWELSQDPAFGAGTITQITMPDDVFVYPRDTTPQGKADVRSSVTANTRLPQGSWYIRSFQIDQFGNESTRSSAISFTISHPPAHTNDSPTNDSVLRYGDGDVTLVWNFTDPSPGDEQTAYEIDVIRTSDGASVASTGVVASSAPAGTVYIPPAYKDVELAWALTVYDTDGVPSPASGQQTFYVSDPPEPTITAPVADSSITSGRPTISWDPGTSGTKVQAAYRLQITQGISILWDTDWLDSTDTSDIVPPGILHNLSNYTLRLWITDDIGQQGTIAIQFSTNYVVPAGVTAFDVYTCEYETLGFVHVGWESTSFDTDFFTWNVYRQAIGEASPTLLAQFSELRPTYGFRDFSARAGAIYHYWITQTVNRFGDLVESAISRKIQVTPIGSHYWLLDPLGIRDAVPMYQVTSDSYTDEHEEAVFNVIGRGRHVDIGDRLGFTGTLGIQCRDKYIGYGPGYNWFSNPALQYASDGLNPDGWTLVGFGSATLWSGTYDSFYEPNPSGKDRVYSVTIDSLLNTAGNNFQAFAPDVYLPNTDIVAGSQVCVSKFIAMPPSLRAATAPLTVSITVYWLDADDTTVLSGSTTTATVGEVFQPAGSDPSGTGNWQRYYSNFTAPAGATYFRALFTFKSTISSSYTIYFGGAMLNSGATPIPQFDGDNLGCTWVDAEGSSSYAPGLYAARKQIEDITTMKELGRNLYMRDPFGDLLLVSLGDDTGDRLAGTGQTDLRDITLPYREVAY